MNGQAGGAGVEGLHGDAFDQVDTQALALAAQRTVEVTVGDHMGEWFAGRDFTIEGQEGRPYRIRGARIGDDHLGDGLCLWSKLGPDAELVEHAACGGGNGGGTAVLLPYAGRSGIDDGDAQTGAGLLERHGGGETDIAGAGNQHVEPCVFPRSCRHSSHLSRPVVPGDTRIMP